MKKKTKRMVLDIALTLLIIASMFMQLTGETLHEIIGALFFVAVLLHLILSFKWMKGSARLAQTGRLKGHSLGLVIMAVLLGIDCAVLGYSSVMISRILASVGLAPALMSHFWMNVHTVSSYVLSGLAVVHLCMHWATLLSWAKVPYNPSRRAFLSNGANAVAALGVVALGVQCANAMELIPFGEDTTEGSTGADSPGETTSLSANDKPEPGASSAGATGETGNAASTGDAAPTKPSGRPSRDGSTRPSAPDTTTDSSNSSSSSNSGSTSSGDTGSSSSSSSSSDASSSSTTVEYCTLCKKRCPLSDPKCDLPYQMGLL